MQNSNKMEDIFRDLEESFKSNTVGNIWVNIAQETFDLKTRLMNVLNIHGKNAVTRRERLLIRKLLWSTGLWKLDLPETKETLEVLYFLKSIDRKRNFCNNDLDKVPPQILPKTVTGSNKICSNNNVEKRKITKTSSKFSTL